jgi:hypothetical protein
MGKSVSLSRMVIQHILPYFKIKVPTSGKLWISSSIHHISIKREYKGSGSGGPHREPTRGSQTIEGKFSYDRK